MLTQSQSGRFILAPSIDLLGGRVVRLRHGDPTHPTVYDTDPARTARRWANERADLLHVVDLDGALAGRAARVECLCDVISAGLEAGIASQVAGGIRDEEAAARALDVGAERVVLGTAFLADARLARRLVARHGSSRIAAALDVRDGAAVGEGWRSGAAGLPLYPALARLLDAGITWIAVTSIAQDGAMDGPDIALLEAVRRLAPCVRLLGSGGVRSTSDVRTLRYLGCDGAILGRSVYEGALTIALAQAALDAMGGDPL